MFFDHVVAFSFAGFKSITTGMFFFPMRLNHLEVLKVVEFLPGARARNALDEDG